ncbi:hypothetical protein RHS03_00375, partial [Rhizoctonia solani]
MTDGLCAHLEAEHGPTFQAKQHAEGLQPPKSMVDSGEAQEEFTLDGLHEHIAQQAAIDDQVMSAVDCKGFIELLVYCG